MKNYDKLVPRDSFVGRYLSYMQNQETAHAYDWWCSLWCISAACGRRIRVARPRAPVFLNMFVVLVGESGRVRKSASVAMAGALVRNITLDTEMGFIDAKVTGEALDLMLHARALEFGSSQVCIIAPELAVFLGTEQYVANMPILLTDLYDCPTDRHGGGTIARGECVQRNVYVSLLGASTPIWLLKAVSPKVVEGGFTSRCLFITATEPKRSIPWPEDGDPALLQDIEDDLRIITAESHVRPSIELTPVALQLFRHWYAKRPRALDSFKQSFEAREDAHVLRIAALLCINDGSWVIDRQHLTTAIQLIGEIKEQSGTIFEGAETRTKIASGLDTIRSILVSAGMDPVAKSVLHRRCRYTLNNTEFQSMLDILHEIGAVQRFELAAETRGHPTEYVRGTELLLARGLGEQVLEKFT